MDNKIFLFLIGFIAIVSVMTMSTTLAYAEKIPIKIIPQSDDNKKSNNPEPKKPQKKPISKPPIINEPGVVKPPQPKKDTDMIKKPIATVITSVSDDNKDAKPVSPSSPPDNTIIKPTTPPVVKAVASETTAATEPGKTTIVTVNPPIVSPKQPFPNKPGIPIPNPPTQCGGVYHFNTNTNKCVLNKDCDSKTKGNHTFVNCNINVNLKPRVIVEHHTNTITKLVPIQQSILAATTPNGVIANSVNPYLLLLSSQQLCLIAQDFQCVNTEAQFTTTAIVTTFDPDSMTWTISGQVKNLTPHDMSNVKVTALFYDKDGNPLSMDGGKTVPIDESIIKANGFSFFQLQQDINDLDIGVPIFVVLSYHI